MAYDYTDTTNYDDQADLIAQTAARIKALRAMQAPDLPEQGGGFTSAVTGTKFLGAQPRANILGQLTPLIAQTRAGYDEQDMNAQKKALSQAQIDNMVKWFKATPQGTPGVPAGPDTQVPMDPSAPRISPAALPGMELAIAQMTDPVEKANAMKALENQKAGYMRTVPGTPAVPATGPDPAEMMAHAAAGMNNPLTKTLAAQYAANGMITRPEKLEERGWQTGEKAQDRAATLSAAQAKAAADAKEHALTRQTTLEAARIRAAGDGTAKGTYVLGPDGVTYVNNKNPSDQRPSGMEKPPKPMTDAAIKAQTERQAKGDASSMIVQSYKPEYSGNAEAIAGANETLPLGKYLPGIGGEAQQWWSNYRDYRADIKHGRYGASFTGPERKMANSYDIDVATDPVTAQRFLTHMNDVTQKSVLRGQSLAENPGAKMLADGSIQLKDGSIVPGTASTVTEDILKQFAPRPAAAPTGGRRSRLPNAVAATEAPTTPSNVAPTPATTTPDADVPVNGTSSLDINRQAYNTARNRYNSQPTPANKQARDIAYADLLRAQSEAGSDEGVSIPAAVRRANSEMGGSARTQRAAAPKDAPKPKPSGGWKVERVD